MDVRLEDEAIRSAVSKAILDSLTQAKREELITKAIGSLLELEEVKVEGGYFGQTRKRAKLQGMFEQAVQSLAIELVRDHVRADETLKAKLRELIQKAVEKFCEDKQDSLAFTLGCAIAKALTAE